MDLATAVGTAMMQQPGRCAMDATKARRHEVRSVPFHGCGRSCISAAMFCASVAAFAFLFTTANAFAGEHYALIVSGAAGGDQYAQKYTAWRTAITSILLETYKYPSDHLVVLADAEEEGVRKSTRENVQHALADFRKRLTKDDQLLVLLIGHGTT